MKKRFSFLALFATVTSLVTAQGVQPRPAPVQPLQTAAGIYQTPVWQNAMAGLLTINLAIEPDIPRDDQPAMAALGQLRTILGQQTGEANVQANNQALAALETYINSSPKPSPLILQIAGALRMQNADLTNNKAGYSQAENYFKRAVDPNTGMPNFLRAHKNLAHIYFKTDRPQLAAQSFVKALQLGDNDPVTFGLLGSIYFDQGQLIPAENALRGAMMLNPGITEFKQLLGNVLLQQERYAEAAALFGDLLLEKPNNVQYWNAQANSYIGMDMIDEAAKNLEIVRFLGKADAPMLMLLGDIYLNKEMVRDAADAYLAAVQKSAEARSFTQYYQAAQYLNRYEAFDESTQLLDAIEQNMSELTTKQKNDILTLRSEINLTQGKTEEAVANLEEILKTDPFNGRALIVLGRYYSSAEPDVAQDNANYQQRKIALQQQAITYFERAEELEDIDTVVEALVAHAQLRVKRSELPRAADLLTRAQQLKRQEYIQSYLDQINAAIQSR
ncbi:MAG: tetratricopeptide repeat protein [Verrucomicrobiota bacterium JB022]|nr:tetratricopeptide repeat protein [Verrucomicrobiota bacterium JB022]